MNSELLSHRDGPARVLTLNRPERRNALTPELAKALANELELAGGEADARAVILRGAGGHFCVGLDLRWAATLGPNPSPAVAADGLAAIQSTIRAAARCPIPVVAVIEGSAAGFGVDLAAACDLRLATASAVFTSAFARIGLVPDGGSTHTLPRLMGSGAALRFLAAGDSLDAALAHRLGLVDEVIQEADLEGRVRALVNAIAEGAPSSVRAIKGLLRAGESRALDEALDREGEAQLAALQGPDFKQRLMAFVSRSASGSERA